MATPGTEACDAAGGALRPKWRESPSGAIGGSYPSGWSLHSAGCALCITSELSDHNRGLGSWKVSIKTT
jgi:hypothetical protein